MPNDKIIINKTGHWATYNHEAPDCRVIIKTEEHGEQCVRVEMYWLQKNRAIEKDICLDVKEATILRDALTAIIDKVTALHNDPLCSPQRKAHTTIHLDEVSDGY